MNSLLATLKVDLRRAFLSKSFVFGFVGMLFALYLNTYEIDIPDADYLFQNIYKYGFYILFFLFGSMPYATSYLSDCNNGYIKPIAIRIRLNSYSISKCISTFAAGASAIALGSILFLCWLLILYPLESDYNATYDGYEILLSNRSYFQYFVLRILLTSLAGGAFSVMALCVSSYIRNPFVVLASPVIVYYSLNTIVTMLKLPAWMDITTVFYYTVFNSLTYSAIYSCAYFIVFAVIFGVVFCKNVRKRFENE